MSVAGVARFEALDSWRGICALMVAACHVKTSGWWSAHSPDTGADRFVDFFFVLSGFVIAHAYGDRLANDGSQLAPFLIRRIGRLWPLHIAVLAAFILYEVALWAAIRHGIDPGRAAFAGKTDPAFLPANIALVQAWGLLPSASWNVPAWSISAEAAAYLCFALLWVGAGRRALWIMLALGVMAALLLVGVAPEGMASTYDYGVPRCLFGFSAGVAVRAVWGRIGAWRPPFASLLEIAMLLSVGAGVWLLPRAWGTLVVPLFAAAVLLFAFEAGAISRLLRGRVPRFLGERSYSIYMVHSLIVIGLLSVAVLAGRAGHPLLGTVRGETGFVGPPLAMDSLLIAYLMLVVLVSHLGYRWIEAPGRDLAGRIARRRR